MTLLLSISCPPWTHYSLTNYWNSLLGSFPPFFSPFVLQYTHHLCVSKYYLLNVSRLWLTKGFLSTRRNCSMLGVHKNLSAYRDSVGFGVIDCKFSQANGTTVCHHRTLTVYSGSLTWKHGVLFIFHELNSLNYRLICSFQRLRTSSFNKSCPLVLPVLEPENPSYHCMQGYRIPIVVRRTWDSWRWLCRIRMTELKQQKRGIKWCLEAANAANHFPGFVSICSNLHSDNPGPTKVSTASIASLKKALIFRLHRDGFCGLRFRFLHDTQFSGSITWDTNVEFIRILFKLPLCFIYQVLTVSGTLWWFNFDLWMIYLNEWFIFNKREKMKEWWLHSLLYYK